jgi:hypothetical protein
MIFPYVRYRVDESLAIPSGEIARPEVKINLIGPNAIVEAAGLIDTGADQVFVPVRLAKMLGVEIDLNALEGAKGVGGHELRMWPGEIEIEIFADGGSYRWSVNAGFIESDDNLAPALLGHAGFLEYFQATFDGEAQTIELIPNKQFQRIGVFKQS